MRRFKTKTAETLAIGGIVGTLAVATAALVPPGFSVSHGDAIEWDAHGGKHIFTERFVKGEADGGTLQFENENGDWLHIVVQGGEVVQAGSIVDGTYKTLFDAHEIYAPADSAVQAEMMEEYLRHRSDR